MVGGTEEDGGDSDVVLEFDDNSYAISDDWGLKEAYNLNESVLHHADTLYIAGTHTWRDVADDTLIPLHLVRNSQRYQQALAALRQANGRVKYLAGHSGRSRRSGPTRRRCRGQTWPAISRISRTKDLRSAARALGPHPEPARLPSSVGPHFRF